MRQYVLTPRADRDLDEIWDQLAVRSAANADRVVAQLERAMCQLAESPGIGHWREDLADKRHRFFLVYSYFLIYRQDTTTVQIVRVLHAARDVSKLLDDNSLPH